MKTHGLYGSNFENIINDTIQNLRDNKLALIQKIATPINPVKYDKETKKIVGAYFMQKSTVDYIGVEIGRAHV